MKEITTQELLEHIHCADNEELNEIITAVTERFRQLWPQWDLLFISCEGRTPVDHIRTLERSLQLMTATVKNELS